MPRISKKETPRQNLGEEVGNEKSLSRYGSILTSINSDKSSKATYIVILIIGLLLMAIYRKDWFVAATVNGMPIFNLELQQRLNDQYRGQTLNQMINEKIIIEDRKSVV